MSNTLNNSFNVESGCYPGSTTPPGTSDVFSELISTNKSADFIRSALTGRSSLQGAFVRSEGEIDVSKLTRFLNQLGISTEPGKLSQLIDTILDRLNPRPPAPDPTTAEFVGLTRNNALAFFNSDDLNNITKVSVTGLQSHEKLLGVDFRPNTGDLFAVGSSNRLYTIDYRTGTATQVGDPFAVALSGTSFGVDFNPTVDRIRVVSDAGQNLRINPDTGAIVDADLTTDGIQTDGTLNGGTTSISATAYTNKFSGATATIQYGINSDTDELFIQSPPNAGTQTRVGALGADFGATNGFNIVTENGINTAYAVTDSSLYTIDLTTGAATSLGTVKNNAVELNLVGFAARAA